MAHPAVARNKRDIDKQAKRGEIISAAQALFCEIGFEETSVNAIASRVAVAPNTLYWYFANKDELFVAVLNHLAQSAYNDFLAIAPEPFPAQLLWLFRRLRHYRHLMATVHSRIDISPALRQWHEQFHQVVDAWFTTRLGAAGFSAERVAGFLDIGTLAIEGMIAHNYDDQRAANAIEALFTAIHQR